MDSNSPTKGSPEATGNTWEEATGHNNSKQVHASAEYCSAAFTKPLQKEKKRVNVSTILFRAN